MFERYTEGARRALFFSRYEASQIGSMTITPELLLLGVARADKSLLAHLLGPGVSEADIKGDVERRLQAKEKIPTSVEIPFDEGTKYVLQFSAEEADRLQHRHIGPEHLMLGMLRDEKSGAAALLMDRGLRLDAVREAVAKFVAEDAARSVMPEAAEAGLLIRGLYQLLDRLSTLAGGKPEPRTLLDEIRQRVAALEQQLKARPE